MFLPRKPKNADAGIKQRLLLAKLRPSDLKLKTGPSQAQGREAEIHLNQFDAVARRPHDQADIVDPDVVGLREIKLALLGWHADCIRAQY